jgi:hypothetical protein
MRITRENVEELDSLLVDLIDDTGAAIRDAADTWLEDENDSDERADARSILEEEIDNLASQIPDLAALLGVTLPAAK